MPKKADKNLKTESGTYKSQIRATTKYTGEGFGADKDQAKVERITFRVPKGWGQIMRDYVASSDKYKSVNNMLVDLVSKEIGIPDSDKNQ